MRRTLPIYFDAEVMRPVEMPRWSEVWLRADSCQPSATPALGAPRYALGQGRGYFEPPVTVSYLRMPNTTIEQLPTRMMVANHGPKRPTKPLNRGWLNPRDWNQLDPP